MGRERRRPCVFARADRFRVEWWTSFADVQSTGPDVVKTVTGEDVSFEEPPHLAARGPTTANSGNAHYLGTD